MLEKFLKIIKKYILCFCLPASTESSSNGLVGSTVSIIKFNNSFFYKSINKVALMIINKKRYSFCLI